MYILAMLLASLILIARSAAMKKIMALVQRVAPLVSTVLITGESGTGKEVIARAIHQMSPRRNKQFVAINCGAIPENLLESELFGHVKGSFTGAVRDKEGFFKVASGGTLFLDEIGNVPVNLQVKLLRAIEEKAIIPVGGTQPIPVDIRIIAATNMNLEKEVEAGHFREDLFYRLNMVGIELPPLRERQEDILPLAQFYVSDTVNLTLSPAPISNLPVLNLSAFKAGDEVQTYVSLEANDAWGKPADVYLWLECTRQNSYQDPNTAEWTLEYCDWYKPYPFEPWDYPGNEQCNTQTINPFSPPTQTEINYPEINDIPPFATGWIVTDVSYSPLVVIPVSALPSGYECKLKAGLKIINWDGWTYTVFAESNSF